MQLDFKKVKLSNRDIKRIYFDAFPKNERMPYSIFLLKRVMTEWV